MWPHERSLVKQLADKPFAVIGVNVSEPNPAALKKVVEKENLTWRSFTDPRTSEGWGAIAKKWNLAGTPTIYLIDHKGVIRHKWLGGARAKIIDNAVEKLIQEVEAGAK
ncbi:MAG: TlpA family protein disulfide reductase [Planctomycetes bacterium]|nr:TlpA family protein disulfide reductase [Planctomycetota bacterium]